VQTIEHSLNLLESALCAGSLLVFVRNLGGILARAVYLPILVVLTFIVSPCLAQNAGLNTPAAPVRIPVPRVNLSPLRADYIQHSRNRLSDRPGVIALSDSFIAE
jgi:hypothetical protein